MKLKKLLLQFLLGLLNQIQNIALACTQIRNYLCSSSGAKLLHFRISKRHMCVLYSNENQFV